MPETRDIGRFYMHTLQLEPTAPRFHRHSTSEIEEPYRTGKSLIIRLRGRFAVALGRWNAKRMDAWFEGWGDEEDHLLAAVNGLDMGEGFAENLLERWRQERRREEEEPCWSYWAHFLSGYSTPSLVPAGHW